MVFSTKELPKKIRIFPKNPLIFRQKTSLVQSLHLSLSASLGSTFFCLDLDWITNKGLSIRLDRKLWGSQVRKKRSSQLFGPRFFTQKKHTKGVHKMVLRGSHKNMRFCWIECIVARLVQKLHPPTPVRKLRYLLGLLCFFSPK